MRLLRLLTLLIAVGLLMIVPPSAYAYWPALKGHVFGAESDVPPLCSPSGALVSDVVRKAELLSALFDS